MSDMTRAVSCEDVSGGGDGGWLWEKTETEEKLGRYLHIRAIQSMDLEMECDY